MSLVNGSSVSLVAAAGKLSMLADLKDSDDGKEILRRLVEWADVVICNQVLQHGRSVVKYWCSSANRYVGAVG